MAEDQFFVAPTVVTAPLIGSAFREAPDQGRADLVNELANFSQAGPGLKAVAKGVAPHLTQIARRFVRALARELEESYGEGARKE